MHRRKYVGNVLPHLSAPTEVGIGLTWKARRRPGRPKQKLK